MNVEMAKMLSFITKDELSVCIKDHLDNGLPSRAAELQSCVFCYVVAMECIVAVLCSLEKATYTTYS